MGKHLEKSFEVLGKSTMFDSIPTVADVLYLIALMDDADVGSRSAQWLIPFYFCVSNP